MDKKNYQKPTTVVVKLQHTAYLLSESEIGGGGGSSSARQYRSSWDEE